MVLAARSMPTGVVRIVLGRMSPPYPAQDVVGSVLIFANPSASPGVPAESVKMTKPTAPPVRDSIPSFFNHTATRVKR